MPTTRRDGSRIGSAAPPPRRPEASPLFVFGAAHSGTTILYRMLAHHPGLTWFSQFSLRGGEIAGRRRAPGTSLLDLTLRAVPHDWRKGESRLRRVLVPRPGEARTIWSFLLEGPAADAERVRSVLTEFSRRRGRRRVLAKLPEFHRHLGLLRDAFPHAAFVHIVRDGRAVALSLRPKFERSLDPGEALEEAARHWVDVLHQAEGTSGIDLLELRYEDLCRDVHDVVRSILVHVGLEPNGFPFHRCPPVLSNRNGRWVGEASELELAEVSRIQDGLLRRHGYPRAPALGQA